jgi:GNAT superfamily N-acetyltransferase
MISHSLSGDLAAEHRRDLLKRADAYRLGANSRQRSAHWLLVRLRPIRPSDGRIVTEVFDSMGPQSRLSRFLAPKPRLNHRQLRTVLQVDRDRHAVVAVTRWRGTGIGIAEFVRDRDDPTVAEVSVAVADPWQSRGLGKRLVRTLADHASRRGIVVFTALTYVDNVRVRRLLAGLGDVRRIGRDGATVSYRVELNGRTEPRMGTVVLGAARRWYTRAQLGPVHNYVVQ